MNENVIRVLKEQMWFLGTFSDEPNVVPVLFKGAVKAKGALIITPTKIFVTSPGPDNNKQLL